MKLQTRKLQCLVRLSFSKPFTVKRLRLKHGSQHNVVLVESTGVKWCITNRFLLEHQYHQITIDKLIAYMTTHSTPDCKSWIIIQCWPHTGGRLFHNYIELYIINYPLILTNYTPCWTEAAPTKKTAVTEIWNSKLHKGQWIKTICITTKMWS